MRAVGEVPDDAVEHLHVPLVVVLRHADCGAVKVAIDLVRGRGSANGAVTVARAIEATVRSTPAEADETAFLASCVRNQAWRVRTELVDRSTVLPSPPRSTICAPGGWTCWIDLPPCNVDETQGMLGVTLR